MAALVACKDAPTAPRAIELMAGGEPWAAIAPPASLASAATWLPYLERSGPEGEAAADSVVALEEQADDARASGMFERSSDLHRDARRLALSALSVTPDASVVRESLWAVDHWLDRAREVHLSRMPLMGESVDSVEMEGAAATSFLAAGDTLAGVAHLMAASDLIRRWTPAEIAVRALVRANQELKNMPPENVAFRRADRLVAGAGLELRSGSAIRALQRALYALQLEGGALVDTTDVHAPGDCVDSAC